MKLRRKHLVVFTGVVCIVVAAALTYRHWRRSDAPMAFVLEMRVTDDGAVLLWRANYSGRHARGWVSRVDSEGRTQWWRELPAAALLGGQDALQVGEGIVAVRYSHTKADHYTKIDHSLIAYSYDDGRLLWDRILVPYEARKLEDGTDSEAFLETYVSARFVGGRLLEWADAGVPGRKLLTLDPQTGNVQSTIDAPPHNGTVQTIGSRLLLHDYSKVTSLDVADGQSTSAKANGIGCVVHNDYISVETASDGAMTLVAFPGGDLSARRVLNGAFDPTPTRRDVMHLRRCGTYRDRLVFLFSVGITIDTGETLVVIASSSGEPLTSIQLPADRDWDGESIATRFYERSSLGGQLTRYVPYISVPFSDDSEERLYMLDLEEGKIAWRGPKDESLIQAHLFRGTAVWYLISGLYRDVVAVFDGKTGKLLTASRAMNFESVSTILPAHVGASQLWIASQQWQPVDHPPVAIIDSHSLVPLSSNTITFQDMTAKLTAQLGVQ